MFEGIGRCGNFHVYPNLIYEPSPDKCCEENYFIEGHVPILMFWVHLGYFTDISPQVIMNESINLISFPVFSHHSRLRISEPTFAFDGCVETRLCFA